LEEKTKIMQEKTKILELKNELRENEEDNESDSDSDLNSEVDEYINQTILLSDYRNHTQTRGNKIQRYSPDGKTLIKTYESLAYAIRDEEISAISRGCIKNAIKNKCLYKEFRWAELKRDLSDDTFQEISETVESITIHKDYVVMLNLDKNKIINVFCDQLAAADDRKFKGGAAINKVIKQGTQSGGHYFIMWKDCSDELKNDYLANNSLPEKRAAKGSINIEQLHPTTKKFIKLFTSIENVIKEFKVSRKTIKNACNFDVVCKGYRWRIKNS